MKLLLSLALIATLAASLPAAVPEASHGDRVPPRPHDSAGPVVQIALLLDTSNSMDGLIDQARTRLWQVVKDLARARHGGRPARLEVALFEYGNSRLHPESGYIRQVLAFSDDLDRISSALFSLTTNGGDEYCGAVIARAVRDLDWRSRARDLKLVFIAGNEPFTQGSTDFRDALRSAVSRGIAVNTIFCGSEQEGARSGWREGALLGDGTFAAINQDRRPPSIDCPQDQELARLNEELNGTYLAYGAAGRARQDLQISQDRAAAAAAPSVAAERVAAKASSLYRNSNWDLVDAVRNEEVRLSEVRDEDLPEALRGKNREDRARIVAEHQASRERLQKRIGELSRERDAFLAAELAKLPDAGAAALDEAMRNSVRAQALKLGYSFE
jgi:hypothetical protein